MARTLRPSAASPRALELLQRLPEGAARDRQELDLQMGLSWSVFVARGRHAPEYESALVRARELCERLGDDARLMEALLALANLRTNRRDFGLARELGERVLAMAQQAEVPEILAGAHLTLGYVGLATGQFRAAREHLERAVELFGAGPAHNFGSYLAQNAPQLLAAALTILGYPVTGLVKAQEFLATARRSSDQNSIYVSLVNYGLYHVMLRDTRMMAERADEMVSIATEHEVPINIGQATFFRGWAMAVAGRGDKGIAEMRRVMSDLMVALPIPRYC